ncbi:hypothetical protein Hanom_Chr13g01235461 [Helianthus anomalus]
MCSKWYRSYRGSRTKNRGIIIYNQNQESFLQVLFLKPRSNKNLQSILDLNERFLGFRSLYQRNFFKNQIIKSTKCGRF